MDLLKLEVEDMLFYERLTNGWDIPKRKVLTNEWDGGSSNKLKNINIGGLVVMRFFSLLLFNQT